MQERTIASCHLRRCHAAPSDILVVMPETLKATKVMAKTGRGRVKNLARRIVCEVYAITAGRLDGWRGTRTVAQLLEVKDDEAMKAAVQLAITNGWLVDRSSGRTLQLTDEGRRLAKLA